VDLRAEQMAERRERILSAARGIIGDEGYETLTMRSLAGRARVTVPTIYNLVGGKEAVLFAAVQEQTSRFLGGIEHAPGKPAGTLLSITDATTRELLRVPRYYRSLLLLLLSADSAQEVRDLVGVTLVDEFERALEALRAAGDLAAWAEPASVARRLAGHVTSVSVEWAAGDLNDRAFQDAAVYGNCLMLLGVTEGPSRVEIEARALHAQGRARGRRARQKHNAKEAR